MKNFYLIEERYKEGNIALCILTTNDRENAPNLLKEVLEERYGYTCTVEVTKSCVAYIKCKVTFGGGRVQKYQMSNFVGYEK